MRVFIGTPASDLASRAYDRGFDFEIKLRFVDDVVAPVHCRDGVRFFVARRFFNIEGRLLHFLNRVWIAGSLWVARTKAQRLRIPASGIFDQSPMSFNFSAKCNRTETSGSRANSKRTDPGVVQAKRFLRRRSRNALRIIGDGSRANTSPMSRAHSPPSSKRSHVLMEMRDSSCSGTSLIRSE